MSYYADLGFEAITPETLRERTASPAVQRFLVEGVGPVSVSGIPELGRILLAHGAGAGHLSEFMRQFAAVLASERLQVWAIDFPYMQQMSEEAKRRPPPPVKKTLEHFAAWYDLLSSCRVRLCGLGVNPWAGVWHRSLLASIAVQVSLRQAIRFTHPKSLTLFAPIIFLTSLCLC